MRHEDIPPSIGSEDEIWFARKRSVTGYLDVSHGPKTWQHDEAVTKNQNAFDSSCRRALDIARMREVKRFRNLAGEDRQETSSDALASSRDLECF
jgi:hypothetical protein